MAEKGIECVYVCVCVNMCEYAGKVVIIFAVIIRAMMESHTLWTLNSLLVYIVKCLPVCICMVESGVWSKSCLPLQMHARFPSLRHLKKNKSSPPFWTPSVLTNDKRHRFPPTSYFTSIKLTTSGSSFRLHHRGRQSEWTGWKRLQPPLWTLCLGPFF